MFQRCRTGPAVAALLAALAMPAAAQQPAGIPVESYQLGNGLRVILSPDRSTPVVAVNVWYNVGSRNERPGRSGFAHLFEHMMFQGSANVDKTEHMRLVERAGGSMNGSTSEDRTDYFETLPANRLNLGLWLEADRMRSLNITQENFENQREVVKEERRLRIENSPYGSSFLAASYDAPYSESCFAYDHSVIGSMDDLNAAALEDVQEFFNTYYAPNNATLTVVGDFDVSEAKRMIQEYFGDIPRGPAPPPVTCTSPFAHLPVRDTLTDSNASLPAVFASYGIPAVDDNDIYAITLLGNILGSGESSRLNQRLVQTERAAVAAQAFSDIRRGPGVLITFAIPNQGVQVSRIETLIEEELDKIRRNGISAAELEKAKNRYRASTIRSYQTVLGKADRLQYFAHFYDNPAMINSIMERYMAVTPQDIQRVARQYLVPNNRAVIVTQPATAQE